MEARFTKRLIWIFCLLLACFLLLQCRLAFLQCKQHEQYAVQVLAQENQSVALEDFQRGQLLDRQGHSLTGTYQDNRVVVFPACINSMDAVSKELSQIFAVKGQEIEKMLLTQKPQILPYPVSTKQALRITQKKWAGVLVVPVTFRYGPKPLAAPVIGHLGRVADQEEASSLSSIMQHSYTTDDWVGRQGLEKYYEKELKGQMPTAVARLFQDATGKTLPGFLPEVDCFASDPQRHHVMTTLDGEIQAKVETIMDRKVKKGAVVVMDLQGDLLAMASRPTYQPNPDKIQDALAQEQEDVFLDQCTALFQPGSVFKIVVAAAALEEGLVSEDTMMHCAGHDDPLISCWYAPGHGDISFAQAFSNSCNPAFAQLALQLGPKKIIAYARKMGLADQTVRGYPVPIQKQQDLNLIAGAYNLVNSAVGQGPVLATPVQISAMLNTVVCGGIYRQPRLVQAVQGEKEKRTVTPDKGKRAISTGTAERLRQLLQKVTVDGVGQEAYVPGFGSAGKTGSAQLGGGVESTNAWFTGYVPVENPQYIITVLVRDGESGGGTAAPLFREIAQAILPPSEG